MDTNTTLLSTTTGTTVLGVLIMIYRACNNKRVRSNCCGRHIEMDFKVDEMPPSPPQEQTVQLQNPMLNGATAPKI